MADNKTYTAFYKPVPLGAWFYIQVFLLTAFLIGIIYGIVMVISGEGERRDWISVFHLIIFISVASRLIGQYRKSKINHCFITVDEEGISWLLPVESYKAKEKEIIAWTDIKKVIIGENGITIKYMSTYFTDTVPYATISAENKEQLLAALREQLSSRSIASEDRLAA